jgi:hypothetical protein
VKKTLTIVSISFHTLDLLFWDRNQILNSFTIPEIRNGKVLFSYEQNVIALECQGV